MPPEVYKTLNFQGGHHMNKWFVESETERVYLEEDVENGQWVDIKALLSIGDQDQLSQLLLDVKLDTSNPEGLSRGERRRRAKQGGNVDASFKPSTVSLLQVSIVAWSFLDNNGAAVPVTPHWIGKLKPEWANLIEEEIDARNPLVEQKPLSDTKMPSSVDPLPSQKELFVT
jgi:hypothetical protein